MAAYALRRILAAVPVVLGVMVGLFLILRLAPGDPARMAARIIESADVEPAPLRLVLGSQALESTLSTLRKRIADFEAQTAIAASTDFPPGE